MRLASSSCRAKTFSSTLATILLTRAGSAVASWLEQRSRPFRRGCARQICRVCPFVQPHILWKALGLSASVPIHFCCGALSLGDASHVLAAMCDGRGKAVCSRGVVVVVIGRARSNLQLQQ